MSKFQRKNFMKNIALICIMLCANFALAQDMKTLIEIPLVKKPGRGSFSSIIRPTQVVDDWSVFRMDTSRYTSWLVKYITLNSNQDVYDKFKKGLITEDSIGRYIFEYRTNKDELSDIFFNHKIYFLIGSLKDSSTELIIDTNQNSDFNDEHPITYHDTKRNYNSFDKEDTTNLPFVKVKIEYFDKIGVRESNIFIQPNVFQTKINYNNPLENLLYLTVNTYQFMTNEFIDGENKYIVEIGNDLGATEYSKHLSEILIRKYDDQKNLDSDSFYKIGDSLQVDNNIFYLSDLTYKADTLKIIKRVDDTHIHGSDVGYKAIIINTNDIYNKPVDISASHEGYLLLDFWGTWCVPCISQTPDLINLHKKYKKKLNIISIASRSQKENILKHIHQFSLDWIQINDVYLYPKKSLTDLYRITIFPTYIVVSPQGFILLRTNSVNTLTEYLADVDW